MSRIQVIAFIGSFLVMAVVAQLIRRRRLREEYALFWFSAACVMIGLSLWQRSIDFAARFFGVAYPPSVLFLGVVVVGFLLSMHYSVSLSRLAENNIKLAQEIALLRQQVAELSRPPAA